MRDITLKQLDGNEFRVIRVIFQQQNPQGLSHRTGIMSTAWLRDHVCPLEMDLVVVKSVHCSALGAKCKEQSAKCRFLGPNRFGSSPDQQKNLQLPRYIGPVLLK